MNNKSYIGTIALVTLACTGQLFAGDTTTISKSMFLMPKTNGVSRNLTASATLPADLTAAFAASKTKTKGGVPVDITSTTPYNALAAIFKKASPATFKDVIGWKAGRRFYADNTQYGVMSVGFTTTPTQIPNGGLFTETAGVKVYVLNQDDNIACFDNILDSKAALADARNILGQPDDGTSMAKESPIGVLYTVSAKDDDDNPTIYKITERMYGNYVIEQTLTNDVLSSYAYYFKDVTPKDGGSYTK